MPVAASRASARSRLDEGPPDLTLSLMFIPYPDAAELHELRPVSQLPH
jgi:hypothetical protein